MPSRSPSRLVLTALAALLWCAPSPASAAQPSPQDEYLALVDAYAAGDTRDAVQALAERDDRWVQTAVSGLDRLVPSWPMSRLRAAALLHTEAVAGGWVLPSHGAMHLAAARRYVDNKRGQALPAEFQRGWLLAVSWHFQSELELGAVVPWLDELRDRFPEWGETALATGVFYEVLGWTDTLPTDLAWTSRSRLLGAVPHHTRKEALEQAVVAYRRALGDPDTSAQATVRLGRVLAELGRADEARTLLAPLTATPERRWRYLAALFTALAEARAGHAAAELAAYDAAARIMPGCQTPLVGITAMQRRLGQNALALEAAEALTVDTRACDDPWWSYRFGQPPDRLPALLAALREMQP